MTLTNQAFAKLVTSKAKRRTGPFQPIARYDRDGDCIEFIARPDPFYAERIDKLVTVYYSEETGEIVGSLIKGVSRFQKEMSKKLPGFVIVLQDGRVRLDHIFLAGLWSAKAKDQDVRVLTYKKLIEVAGDTAAEAELLAAG
jgi:hypothetical protein